MKSPIELATQNAYEIGLENEIKRLNAALKGCQTLTPSLMDGAAAIERLKEINCHVYDVPGKR